MLHFTTRTLKTTCVCLLLFTLAGCTKTIEEQIAEARAQYTVTLEDVWIEDEVPVEDDQDSGAAEAVAVAEEAAVGEEAVDSEEAAEGEEDEIASSGPRSQNVLFELVVLFRGRKALDGITVDITHVDEFEEEKNTHLQYIDTAGMTSGETRQVDFELEGLMVEDGDAFSVTLSSGIPADLSNYREFAEPGE